MILIKIWWRKCLKNLLVCPHCWKWATTWIERRRKEIWQLLKMIMSHLVRVSWVKRSNVLTVTWLDLDNTPPLLVPSNWHSNFELKCLKNLFRSFSLSSLKAMSSQWLGWIWTILPPLLSLPPLPTYWHTCFSLLSSNVSKICLVIV